MTMDTLGTAAQKLPHDRGLAAGAGHLFPIQHPPFLGGEGAIAPRAKRHLLPAPLVPAPQRLLQESFPGRQIAAAAPPPA